MDLHNDDSSINGYIRRYGIGDQKIRESARQGGSPTSL
jgi:hypothetical protein